MIDEMRAFVLLAETGSIAGVAAHLPLTQPAVSRQIQRLERDLGAVLLDRRVKPPVLTPAGIEALARCRAILAGVDDLKAGARGRPSGTLRIGIAQGLGDAAFAAAVGVARQRYPDVTLRLSSAWTPALTGQLARGGLDAVFGLMPETGGDYPLAVVADRAMRLTRAELARRPWIVSTEPCDVRATLTAALGPVDIAAEVPSVEMMLALVEQRMGLALLPRALVRRNRRVTVADWRPALRAAVWRAPHLGRLAPVVDLLEARSTRMPAMQQRHRQAAQNFA